MSIFNWFKPKRHIFDNEDRELSAERRRLNQMREQLKIQQDMEMIRLRQERDRVQIINEISELRGGDDSDDMADGLFKVLLSKIPFNQLQNSSQVPVFYGTPPKTAGVSYSDFQLQEMYKLIPKNVLKQAKRMTPDELKSIIRNRFLQDADEESLNRAASIVLA